MLIAAYILGYILFGLIVFGGMVVMTNKGIDFNLRDKWDDDISVSLIMTIVAWPLILLFIYPYVIFNHYLKK